MPLRPKINTHISDASSHEPSASLWPGSRARSQSNASTTSEVDIITPASSSTNASTSSLPLNDDERQQASSSKPSSRQGSQSPAPSDYVVAMHDYTPSHSSATCLEFRAGQIIHVLNRDNSGWWDGELDGRRGWFPSNYVNDVSLGDQEDQNEETTEETIHQHQPPQLAHRSTKSTASAASWASAPVNGVNASRSMLKPTSRNNIQYDQHCHPLMVPLLHGLSLLQSAVRSNRVTHFQPSTACIVSCIRSVLSATECLTRDSEAILQFPILAPERKRILSTLGLLVSQAKKASDFEGEEKAHLVEIDSMLRLGGQLFASVRQFLSVVVQCGLELPQRRNVGGLDQRLATPVTPSPDQLSPTWDQSNQLVRTPPRADSLGAGRVLGSNLRSRSMVNLRTPKPQGRQADSIAPIPVQEATPEHRIFTAPAHRQAMPSISSIASSDSAASSAVTTSVEHDNAPVPPPPFPRGPTPATKVLEALRITHDHYLSTIAAFIGHAHSHSRTSHASSTGHMYDLVREIVEMVCRLLTIVDAVMRHPNVPALRLEKLKAAKGGLYNVTSSLAESVRLLTATSPTGHSEDEEKQALLRSATGALKAGADCVFSVKTCLNRSPEERSFVIMMAEVGPQSAHDIENGGGLPIQLGTAPRLRRSLSLSHPASPRMSEEDATVQAVAIRRRDLSSGSEDDSLLSKQSQDTELTTPDDYLAPRPPMGAGSDADLVSLTSPSDDGTAWETGGQTPPPQPSAQEIAVNGDFPPLPLEEEREVVQDPGAWMLSHDYSLDDIAYNSDGQLVGATLPVLVEKLTPHDVVVDPGFQSIFFLTFRLFSNPTDLVDAIINRYTIDAPAGITLDERALWQKCKGVPVRLRVANLVRVWLEQYWQPTSDRAVLDSLTHFVHRGISGMFPSLAQRIADLLEMRRSNCAPTNQRRGDPAMLNPPGPLTSSEVPRPTMTKNLLSLLRSRSYSAVQITDFDPLELARQLTIRESDLYCLIAAEDVLQTGQDGFKSPTVKEMSKLSTTITGWVAENILSEHDTKKRTLLVKFYIKVADRCTSLNNFSTSRSILAALDSSTISRLSNTWNGLSQKSRGQLEALRKLADHSRNYREYRTALRNTSPPAVPFLGLYLTDVTFCREGNPSTRTSPMNPDKKLLNFNKYLKLARIVQDMQRFQAPYQLKVIPEVQMYLNDAFEKASGHGDLQDLYRRSLMVEPRQAADAPPPNDVGKLFGKI